MFNGKERQRTNPDDEAVYVAEGKAPRRAAAVSLRRLLRDIPSGRRRRQQNTGHNAHKAQQRRLERPYGDGRISASRARHIPAKARKGGQAGGHLRPAGGPQAHQEAR